MVHHAIMGPFHGIHGFVLRTIFGFSLMPRPVKAFACKNAKLSKPVS